MKVKIFLGEYTYIYRGDIDLTEMNEFVKTLTNRAFVIKWKDQEGDLITITKKQDLAYFYQLWTENSATNKQSFRLFVHEIPQIIQNLQITQLQSQSQIYSKMFSPSQRQSISKQSGISQFTFGLQLNEQAKSVDIQKNGILNRQIYNQQLKYRVLQRIQAIKIQTKWQKQRLGLDFNNIHAQDLSFFMNMDMKQSINRKEFTEIQLAVDDDYEDCDDFGNINYNDREKFDIANIYCDYCSDKIEEESTMLYTCQFCEDFHACQLCFDQYQEQVHVHQLQENILQ